MFLGLRSKTKKGASVQVDYVVHIQEIAPWPPSQSLKSLRSVILQWQCGDNVSGLIPPVVPSIEEGRIQFNKSFKLHVVLIKDGPVKGHDGGQYHKNLLELNLYEPRNKNLKGHHIGGVVVDLAEHGILKKPVNIGAPFTCKRSFKNSLQPVLYVKIQPYDRTGSSSSLESLAKDVLSDKDGKESVSSVMTEEQGDEIEIASFTDEEDNESQQSSNDQVVKKATGAENKEDGLHSESASEVSDVILSAEMASKLALTTDIGATEVSTPEDADYRSFEMDHVSSSCSIGTSLITKSSEENIVVPPTSLEVCQQSDTTPCDEAPTKVTSTAYESGMQASTPVDLNFGSKKTDGVSSSVCSINTIPTLITSEKPSVDSSISSVIHKESTGEITKDTNEAKPDLVQVEEKLVECNRSTVEDFHQPLGRDELQNDISCSEKTSLSEENIEETQIHSTPRISSNTSSPIEQHSPQLNPIIENSQSSDEHRENALLDEQHKVQRSYSRVPNSTPSLSRRSLGGRTSINHGRKHAKSVSVSIPDDEDFEDVKGIDVSEDTFGANRTFFQKNLENTKKTTSNKQSEVSNCKIKELEKRVEILERELREIAAIEISLYSVVAEHGSSAQKVHAPARRLSRLCTYASENLSPEGRASATRSIVSGLILAARACGNDVPRLTFWLSNSIVLRATVTPVFEGLTVLTSTPDVHASSTTSDTKTGSLKWEQVDRYDPLSFSDDSYNWMDPRVFLEVLEKVEDWIFSRIVESIWWQILIPRMQSGSDSQAKSKLLQKGVCFISPRFADQRTNYSIDLWKKAFKDSYERLCPVRAEGHDCGCLPMLSRLVMEQCIARLDVAMFNAVLRESDDDIPGHPISDPITDCKVLPISPGKLTFSDGAQLKNAIGTWSRWLTDLFGIDDELSESEKNHDDGTKELDVSLKTFYLLNALSDLLMLPKDMLLDGSTKKEVCSIFSESMIIRILGNFVPDEFCPDPVPDAVFEALGSEETGECGDAITRFPCEPAPVAYHPPPLMLVLLAIGHIQNNSLQRSSSSMPRKCHTSDDELEELNSPLTSIVTIDKSASSVMAQTRESCKNAIRYQLLREVWRHGD